MYYDSKVFDPQLPLILSLQHSAHFVSVETYSNCFTIFTFVHLADVVLHSVHKAEFSTEMSSERVVFKAQ